MADEVDKTDERASVLLEASVSAIRNAAAAMPQGKPGDCDLCGELSGRLINGACARCRDKHKLP